MLKRLALIALALALAGTRVEAQPRPAVTPPTTAVEAAPSAAEELVSQDSPRASMTRFLTAARAARWDEAARYLDLPRSREGDAPRLARELLEVLDRQVWIDPSALSNDPQGDPGDRLPARTDEVARLQGPTGATEPVRITRRTLHDEVRWVFTRQTTARIEAWYGGLEGRWIRERLPAWSLRRSARHLLVWQWIALPLLALASLLLARVLATLTNRAASRAVHRVWPDLAEALHERALGPVTGLWMVPVFGLGADAMNLYPPAAQALSGVVRAALFVAVFWGVWGSVGVLSHALLGSAWARAHPSSETLVPLGMRVLRVLVVALAVTAVLSALGYPVVSLVAGLGVGGLALALAAQKTGEHLFGSFAIGLDQPFRVGDTVKIEDHLGTVESLGLRSTRIRTLGRTVVTIPNGKLADLRIENYTLRDSFFFNPKLALAPGTAPETVEAILAALRETLEAHPDRAPDEPNVFVHSVTAESVVVEAQGWIRAESWAVYLPLRTALYLRVLRVARDHGATLAAPIRVLRNE